MLRVGVLASHQGTNFQAIVDACAEGNINAVVSTLISNNSDAPVMARAVRAGITTHHLSSRTHPNPEALDHAICEALLAAGTDLVVLAGYMKKLGTEVLSTFEHRIINVHPSLLPKYGGKGLFGMRVHEAVLEAGETESGATVHLVDSEYDQGDILRQRAIPIENDETAESLAAKVHAIEHDLLLDTIHYFSQKA